jgi:hypothetical protein
VTALDREIVLYKAVFVAVIVGLLWVGGLGCASVRITVTEQAGRTVTTTSITPGLRNMAVCFDEDTGKLESVIAYKQSRTFAGQNVVLGAAVGGALGGPVGAGAGGVMGLLSELLDSAVALGDQDPTPTCEPPPAPPLRPDEVPVTSLPPVEPRPPRPPIELGFAASWNQFACGGVMEPEWCR